MKQLYSDLVPFTLFVILILIGFVVFWSIADMVVLGASLAVVLIPAAPPFIRAYPARSLGGNRNFCDLSCRVHHGTFHLRCPFIKCRRPD